MLMKMFIVTLTEFHNISNKNPKSKWFQSIIANIKNHISNKNLRLKEYRF